MCKIEKLDNFIELSKNEKRDLTLSWLIDLVKTERLSIEDVVDIINNIEPTFSKAEKLECLLLKDKFSTSTISRLFGLGYAKSMKLIKVLIENNLVVKYDSCYKVIDKKGFKDMLEDVRKKKWKI
ncbi:MAG: hypothetical protein IKY10_03955 [Clostridia bacterium]|nr:hypothetical protein [Clostridia bacterium]